MTTQTLNKKLKRITELKAQIAELQNEMELLKDEVTEYMTASDLMECNTKKYIIKLTPITKTYVDSKLLKSTHPKIYSSCCKQTTYTTLYIK